MYYTYKDLLEEKIHFYKNIIIIAFVGVMFFLNVNVFSVCSTGSVHVFVTGYLNDMAAPCLLFAYTDILCAKAGHGLRGILLLLSLTLCAGLFWEIFSPVIREGSVTDPLDIAAYMAGGIIYWLVCGRDPVPASPRSRERLL